MTQSKKELTLEELKAEALKHGYRLERIPAHVRKMMRAFPNNGKPWKTTEETAIITGMKKGLTLYQMAEEIGRTPTAVADRLVELRILCYDRNMKLFTFRGKLFAKWADLKRFTNDKVDAA